MEYLLINGAQYPLEEKDYDKTLLRYLRENLDLTGTKCGCNVGQCGSCNVIIDGKIRRSCVVKCGRVIGQSIRTIEGLAQDGKLHPVQESFLKCGVMQCGYCTPAQVITAVALLEQNPNPTRADIDKAFKGTLCRCGAYVRVLRAIDRAAAIMRGETWVDEEKNDPGKVIGNSYDMPDAVEKITGKTKYCGDYYFPNMVYGKLVFADYPHARLLDIDVDACLVLPGVVWVHCFKTAPVPIIGSLEADMPIIGWNKVRHAETPAHPRRCTASFSVKKHSFGTSAVYRLLQVDPVYDPDDHVVDGGRAVPDADTGGAAGNDEHLLPDARTDGVHGDQRSGCGVVFIPKRLNNHQLAAAELLVLFCRPDISNNGSDQHRACLLSQVRFVFSGTAAGRAGETRLSAAAAGSFPPRRGDGG